MVVTSYLNRWMRSILVSAAVAVLVANASEPNEAQGARPAARACHSVAYLPNPSGVVLFGGATECGTEILPDKAVWHWDGRDWRRLTDAGFAREDVLLVFDPTRSALVLFGGRTRERVFEDTWVWDKKQWTRTAATGPGPLEHAAMAYDEQRRAIVLFGGANRAGGGFSGNTWTLTGDAWRRSATGGPAARIAHSMVWSASHGGVLLYGGFNDRGPLNDLWLWDGAQWKLLDGRGPASTEGPALTDAAGSLLLVGAPTLADRGPMSVWKWERGSWKAINTNGPAATIGHGLAFDKARKKLVWIAGAFPGRSSTVDVWEFSEGQGWSRAPAG
jgi:hypothetical protein